MGNLMKDGKKKGLLQGRSVRMSLISKEFFMHGAHIAMIGLSSWL
jgi:hypothetical protein